MARVKWLDHLERKYGRFAVPNVILTLVVAQLIVYALILTGRVAFGALPLIPKAVLANGEWWRLFSFVISPPWVADSAFSALFLAFFWYILWMMSQALESAWGVFRFNVYLLLGIAFSLLTAFAGQWLSPEAVVFVTPRFLYLSVFLAFATVNPDFEFLLFFVLPVKVKWLAWLAGALILLTLLSAPSLGQKLAVLGPVLNYGLFFGKELAQGVRARKRHRAFAEAREAEAGAPFHECGVCGATDQTHPEREFRYKTADGGAVCVCEACRGTADAGKS